MDLKKSIRDLERVLEKSKHITIESASDSNFLIWKNLTSRSLEKIYGPDSTELKHFQNLDFCFRSVMTFLDVDYSVEDLKSFRKDFKIATETIQAYLQELKEECDSNILVPQNLSLLSQSNPSSINKVFISHASADKEVVEELVDLLETIGLSNNEIFCSSFPGYGIELGENFLDRIKNELDKNVIVLFVLSNNFYNSTVCLCEMGATWVKTNEHIPILVPPFDFKDIKGVIPLTQGFKITDNLNLNLLKDKISNLFFLTPIDSSVWERKRDRFIERLKEKLNITPIKTSSGFGYRKAIR